MKIIVLPFSNICNRILRPGAGLKLAGEAKEITVKETPPIVGVLLNIIPTDPLATLVQGKVLQIIFFAIVPEIAFSLSHGEP